MTGTWLRLALVLVAALTGCKRKHADAGAAPGSASPSDAALRVASIGSNFRVREGDAAAADAMIAAIRAALPAGRAIDAMHFHYVRANGTIDAQFGEATVSTGDTAEAEAPPADDPKRPIGAPVVDAPDRPPAQDCSSYVLRPGGVLETIQILCAPVAATDARDACTIARLWQLAIADGAPANAVASFDLKGPTWWVSIDDEPRNYHFNHRYEAVACRSVAGDAPLPVEAAPIELSTAPPPPIAPCPDLAVCKNPNKMHGAPECCSAPREGEATEVDIATLRAAVDAIRPALKKCSEAAPTTSGTFRAKVTVERDGKARVRDIVGTDNAKLRACITDAIVRGTYPKVAYGIEFSMPVAFTAAP